MNDTSNRVDEGERKISLTLNHGEDVFWQIEITLLGKAQTKRTRAINTSLRVFFFFSFFVCIFCNSLNVKKASIMDRRDGGATYKRGQQKERIGSVVVSRLVGNNLLQLQ